ncbi:CDP-glucose 4,6-dehydratase [Chitinophaga barathri]|uniref:CDP-glucose 4,6-dehydratase n=1 Tax=Chitinophaga barathri TaxID=1647451 RepID=A0A3N4MK81_9BACT|nr:CDP-glucose 4,6-dehydratase [Chitinophaga barathri]RPD40500.1 CDP-glucose 4,6-dehydratase [Chitinophaga barathri]
MIFSNTYKGKKVLITGHTGFKGSWLLSWLFLLGAKVKGYALPPENENDLFNEIGGTNLCESIFGDIMDYPSIEKEILEFEPDFIFHLAAQPLVRLSYEKPVETFSINGIGTAHILEATKKLARRCNLILITTDKVYHNHEWLYPYRENDRLGGYDPYSASKACMELIIESYRNSFFNSAHYENHKKAIAVARAGNVIGGGDWAKDRIIPDTVRALRQNEPVIIRNPKAIRPWQHVMEPLCGYLLLGYYMEKDPIRFSTAYNFGPYIEDNLEVEDLVKKAIEIWQKGKYEIRSHGSQPHEAGLLKLDISKALSELDWRPRLNANEAINKTISWYKNAQTTRAFELVKKDILDYENA